MPAKMETRSDPPKRAVPERPGGEYNNQAAQEAELMPTKEEVGRRVRLARFKRNMTLKEVANRSGMSATHISEIERGKTSPTIGALQRIASALEEKPSHFVEEHEVAHAVLTKRADREIDYTADDEGRVLDRERLTSFPPWSTTQILRRQMQPGERFHRDGTLGESVIIVGAGMLRVAVGDEEPVVLREGDSLQFRMDRGFTCETLGEDPTDAMVVAAYACRSNW